MPLRIVVAGGASEHESKATNDRYQSRAAVGGAFTCVRQSCKVQTVSAQHQKRLMVHSQIRSISSRRWQFACHIGYTSYTWFQLYALSSTLYGSWKLTRSFALIFKKQRIWSRPS